MMKKSLIGLSVLVILSFAVLLFVNAKASTLKSQKAATESVLKCKAAGECAGMKCEKAACDQAKSKDCDPATCPKAQNCPKTKEGCKMQAASSGCQKVCPMAVK